jgi:hypothetical protein
VNASNAVEIHAAGPVTMGGTAPVLVVDAPAASVEGSFSQVSNLGGGLVSVNGKPQAPDALSANVNNSRVVPAESTILGDAGRDDDAAAGFFNFTARSAGGEAAGQRLMRAAPGEAQELIERGLAVEIDLAPGNARR